MPAYSAGKAAGRPEDVISKGNVDWIAKDTMGYFLSQVFKKYELLQEPLPTRYDVKSAYYGSLLKRLRDRYGAALDGTNPPLQLEDVPGLTMSKFDEKVSVYAESILNPKYEALARRLKELAAMTEDDKVLAAQKEAMRQTAPPKNERRRRNNPKRNLYI
jgi:hypothetical protein